MNKQDHDKLLKIQAKGQLTYTRDDMRRASYGKPFNYESDQSILDDVATINEIMKRHDDTFVEFKSFTEDGRIRYDHLWEGGSFTGVGYTRLDLLELGMPLGNYTKEYEQHVLNGGEL